jgi:hypothetical protein
MGEMAQALLDAMAREPNTIEYHTRLLGGVITDESLAALDRAYLELAKAGLVERAGPVISFFGAPKSLYRITPAGVRAAQRGAA